MSETHPCLICGREWQVHSMVTKHTFLEYGYYRTSAWWDLYRLILEWQGLTVPWRPVCRNIPGCLRPHQHDGECRPTEANP